MIATGAAASTILFMAAGCFLTVIFFVAAALIVVGYFKPSARLRKGGWIVLAIWILPSAFWSYNLMVLIEPDQYRTLTKPEIVYGIPLPAGAQVNVHRWARRVLWVSLPSPQTIQGVEYVGQITFSNGRVSSATLARSQAVDGVEWPAGTTLQLINGKLTKASEPATTR